MDTNKITKIRVCPNCKLEMEIIFKNKKLAPGVIENCPRCNSAVLFCPDDYIVESIAPFVPVSELNKNG